MQYEGRGEAGGWKYRGAETGDDEALLRVRGAVRVRLQYQTGLGPGLYLA